MNVHDIAARLPSIDVVRDRCRALAVLELIQGSDYPYYTYAAGDDGDIAQMSNGGGDEYSIVFAATGVFLRMFDHESEMSPYAQDDQELWPGLLDGLPPEFEAYATDPDFCDLGTLSATAVLWRRTTDDRWHAGTDIAFPPPRGPYDISPDGTDRLAILCDGDLAGTYTDFARDYYEKPVDGAAVEHIAAMRPLTETVVSALNPAAGFAEIRATAAAIGYPTVTSRDGNS